MTKPVLFVELDSDFFINATLEKREEVKQKIIESTSNEYHVILHDGVKNVICAGGERVIKYF